MKLFDFFRRKNKVEQEENVQDTSVQEENAQEAHEESVGDDNKQEDSVEETASEESAQDSINDSEVNETNKGEKADKDSDDTENEDAKEVDEENEDDEPSDEPDDDDIEEDEADDDEIDEDDTEEEDETEDEEDEVEEDDEEDDEEREHREISFDYEQFEEDLCTTFEEFMKGYLDRKEDMYIFSVNYFPDFTTTIGVNANSYSYLNEKAEPEPDLYADYKFCEEEWEVGEWFEDLSKQLQVYFDQLEEEYEDEEDTHDELYEEHEYRIIDICKNVMNRIKETDTFKAYPQMLLNVYVREFFGDEEVVEIFKDINGDAVPDDYLEFVESWQ